MSDHYSLFTLHSSLFTRKALGLLYRCAAVAAGAAGLGLYELLDIHERGTLLQGLR